MNQRIKATITTCIMVRMQQFSGVTKKKYSNEIFFEKKITKIIGQKKLFSCKAGILGAEFSCETSLKRNMSETCLQGFVTRLMRGDSPGGVCAPKWIEKNNRILRIHQNETVLVRSVKQIPAIVGTRAGHTCRTGWILLCVRILREIP